MQDQALATFNFLNSEKRYIAGAFVPPAFLENVTEEDEYNALMDTYLTPQEKDFMLGDLDTSDPEELKEYREDSREALKEITENIVNRQ